MSLPITDIIKNLRISLNDIPKSSWNQATFEVWTNDGITVSDTGTGAKIVLPLRPAAKNLNETEKPVDNKPRENRWKKPR